MKKEVSIDQLERGQEGTLLRFTDEVIAQKLISMGMLPGKKVSFVRAAPFAGAYYIKVEGHRIAIRDREAQSIILAFE